MNAKTESKIKLLSNLGLSSQMFIRVLLPELKKITATISYTFVQLDKNFNVTQVYDQSPNSLQVAYKYYRESGNSIFSHQHTLLGELTKKGQTVTTTTQLFPNDFYNSQFYTDLWQPSHYHHSIIACLTLHDTFRVILLFHRTESQPLFSNNEIKYLMTLLPHIKTGISGNNRAENTTTYTDYEESGLLIFDPQGNLCLSNSQGKRLIMLAASPSYFGVDTNKSFIPQLLVSKIKKFSLENNYYESKDDTIIWTHANDWGKFIFRANWLQKDEFNTQNLISVNIQNLVPLPLKVLHRCNDLELTNKQTDICIQLVKGNSYNDISKKLYISSHTVVDHVRKLYEKLQVGNRTELVTKLTANN